MPTQPTVVASVDAGAFATVRTITTGTIGSWTPALNDCVVVVANLPQTNSTTITTPADWVNPLGGNTVVSDPVSGNLAMAYHLVTSGEASAVTTSWTLTNWFDANKSGRRVSFVVRGVDPLAPVDVASGAGANTANWVAPNLLPMKTGSLVCAVGGINAINTSRTVTSPSAPWASIVGTYSSAGTTRTGFAMQSSTPAVSSVAFSGVSLSIGATEASCAATIAFAPVPDAASGAFFTFF